MLLICLCLLTKIFSGYCEDVNDLSPYDDDDIYSMVNVYLYDSKDDCLYDNRLHQYIYNYDIHCDCLEKSECYDTLFKNKEFNDTFFVYNNKSIYLHDLNYSTHCYKYGDVFIKGILVMDTYCVPKIIGFIVVCVVLIFLLFITINILKDNKKICYKPPEYKSTKYNTI